MSSAPPPPPPGAPRLSGPVRALCVAIPALLVVGAVTVAVRIVDDEGLAHPDQWDPRVVELADFVEDARGLDFKHPVYVDFLTPDEYTKVTTGELDVTEEEELDDLQQGVAQLRALGLISGDLDLRAVIGQATDAGTLAFYSPDDERIRVRGTELTVGLRVTLVHELTHALQDQWFDLDALLFGDEDESTTTDAGRALAEGDAVRIEDEYILGELGDEELEAYDAETQEDIDTSQAALTGVPAFIQASFAVPYVLGAPFVTMLYNDGRNKGVNDAFDDPPTTDEHLFDPASYLLEEGADEPELGLDDGTQVTDEGFFGSPSWYLVLAERIDPSTAFTATIGWGGDGYAVYERDDVTCIRVVFSGDEERDEDEMGAAIDQWLAALPGERATRLDVDGHPGLEACDPGPDVDMQLTGRSMAVLPLPQLWAYLIADGVDAGREPEESRCVATRVLDGFPFEQAVDPEAQDALFEEVARRLVSAGEACGSGDR